MNENADLRSQLLDAAVELMGRSGRGGVVRVHGTSMLPMLRPGQRLAVEFATDRLRIGDLLLYRQLDYLVVHRLIGRFRASAAAEVRLKTRGDARVDLDPPLDRERLVGRVTAFRNDEGWWDLRGRGARTYATCVAWHDRTWAAIVALAGMGDRGFAKLGLRTPFLGAAARIDHGLLLLAHRLVFRGLHRRAAPPLEADSEPASDDRLLY